MLYEQGALLVVNKPGGVLTQAPPGIDSMEVRVKRFLKSRIDLAVNRDFPASELSAGNPYVGVPHRLDRPVSGAMLFGADKQTTRKLALQFENRSVTKKYWALVEGQPDEQLNAKKGSLTDYVRKLPNEPRSEIVLSDHPDAQFALLNYRVLQQVGEFTWLEIELETGRTHQIRLQFGSRGHPVIGDAMYGSRTIFGEPEPDERKRCIALHARHLRFEHPASKQQISIDAPLPPIWESFSQRVS